MQLLEERIRNEGKILPGNIVKIDGFLNHRVDTSLLRAMAKEFGKHFDLTGLTAVLTVEASGIALATICAEEYHVPMLFAKKAILNIRLPCHKCPDDNTENNDK